MIYDALAHAALYRDLGPRFAAAFDFLAGFDPATPTGRVSLDGDNLFALVQSYQTAPAATKPFESHRIFATLYSGPDDTPLRLRPSDFCVLWPQDGHKPCCQSLAPTAVKKVVIKVRL